jgi:hypothetical protein
MNSYVPDLDPVAWCGLHAASDAELAAYAAGKRVTVQKIKFLFDGAGRWRDGGASLHVQGLHFRLGAAGAIVTWDDLARLSLASIIADVRMEQKQMRREVR